MARQSRRRLLQGGLAIAGIGVLSGCGMPLPGGRQRRASARIGLLTPSSIGAMPHGRAFLDGLREHGWVQGENLTVDSRFARAKESVAVAVADLLALQPDVIVAEGPHNIQALKSATDALPIVMALSSDPVATGLVASLARPSGNVTGVASLTTELTEKRLDLLKQVVPRAALIAGIWEPDLVGDAFEQGAILAVAARLGLQMQIFPTRLPDLAAAFEAAARSGADALVTLTEYHTGGRAPMFGALTVQYHLPTIVEDSDLGRAGGLLTYGPSLPDLMRRVAAYVDMILRGAKPADLPVEQPTTFDFVINLRTAHALGLTVPQAVLQQATEIIE